MIISPRLECEHEKSHGNQWHEMRSTHRHLASARAVGEPAWTKDRPFERVALAQGLVRLIFPLHHNIALQVLGHLQVLFVL
jgi:hypothetical protein